ncbi:unnamed protein product, partial [marine sediment metagenome]
ADFNLEGCFINDGHYVNATLISFDSGFNESKTIGRNFEVYCRLQEREEKEEGQSVSCFEQKYYSLVNKNGKIERGMLNLLIATAKSEGNVR